MRASVAFLAAAVASLGPKRTNAATKTPKTDVQYQFAPKGDQRCGLCASFIPAADRQAAGACKIVDGPIPPTGWCVLFSKP